MLLYTQIHRARGLQVLERERKTSGLLTTHMKTPDEYEFSGISFQQVREAVFKERIIKAVNYITKLQIVSHIFFYSGIEKNSLPWILSCIQRRSSTKWDRGIFCVDKAFKCFQYKFLYILSIEILAWILGIKIPRNTKEFPSCICPKMMRRNKI